MAAYSGDKQDHTDIPTLVSQALRSNRHGSSRVKASLPVIIVPNYRLSANPERPDDRAVHPGHVDDVRKALDALLNSGEGAGLNACPAAEAGEAPMMVPLEGSSKDLCLDSAAVTSPADQDASGAEDSKAPGYTAQQVSPSAVRAALSRIQDLYVAGHSCGAHMVAHLLRSAVSTSGSASDSTWLHDPRLRGVAFLDGIYDSRALVEEYPDYEGFMRAAGVMGEEMDAPVPFIASASGLAARSSNHGAPPAAHSDRPQGHLEKIIVAHADADELLTPRQSREWFDKLSSALGGEHERGLKVIWDDKTLKGTHDGCLHHPGLGELLVDLMSR